MAIVRSRRNAVIERAGNTYRDASVASTEICFGPTFRGDSKVLWALSSSCVMICALTTLKLAFPERISHSIGNVACGLTTVSSSSSPRIEADANVAAALMANAATRVIFRVGDDDAKKLADGFASFDAQALTSLGIGEAVCRIDRADHDFNLKTRIPVWVDAATAAERRERIVEQSRARYSASVRRDQPGSSAPATPALPSSPKKKDENPATKRPTRLKDFLDRADGD